MRAVAAEEQVNRVYGRIARDLSHRFDGVFGFETVERVVARVRLELDLRSRITDFIPVLVEKLAREELSAAARAPSLTPGSIIDLLYVGPEDGGRAGIAAELTARLTGPRACVRTAGPGLADLTVRAADVVVTLGGGVGCPVFPGKRYLDWDVLDPTDQDLETVLAVRADLQTRVSSLVSSLGI